MVFHCQKNCYDKELTTKVLTCEPCKLADVEDGKKVERDCFKVIFEDTVLFPEGGGQPFDTGTVNEIPVIKVLREGGEAVHYLTQPIEVGSEATQKVNWTRRHDHMQQHSGQHLITAVADLRFGYPTLSWSLGPKISYIELDTAKLSSDEMSSIETEVNEKIRVATPVITKEYEADDPQLKEVRTRGLPDNVVGRIRVVTISELDDDMCCGTHVKNLSDLQAIKLTHSEKGKKSKTLLYFLCGHRVLDYLGNCLERERELNTILHTNPQDHIRLVEKVKKDLKQSTKCLQDSLKDLAVIIAQNFVDLDPRPKYFIHRRKDGDQNYLSTLSKAIDDSEVLKVLCCGQDTGPGILLVDGPPEISKEIGQKLCAVLDGKGGGKSRFTAQVNKLTNWIQVENVVKEHFHVEE